MIYSLKGKISVIDENTVVVDTGSVSFEVICSTHTAYEFSQSKEVQTILTYMQVREDAMTLFGFKNQQEKSLFNELSQISGIGPKKAISVLSGLKLEELVKAITTQDVKMLSTIKGLGKKTAELIILKLSGKLGGIEGIEGLLSSSADANSNLITMIEAKNAKAIDETIEVLVSTGVSKANALEMAKKHYVSGMTSEELVFLCFKNMR